MREAKRQREMTEQKEKPQIQLKKKSVAWSEKIEAKERKSIRKEKKQKKREYLKRMKEEEEAKKKRALEDEEDDWEELAKEERLFKKVKKGQLDRNTFDDMFT